MLITNAKMINENIFEIRRKIFHLVLGVFFVFTIYYNILEFWMILSLLIIGILISLLSIKKDVPLISYFLIMFERPENSKNPGIGVISIFSSLSVLVLLMETGYLEKNIVLASIMIWAFGDSTSAIFGKLYGRRNINRRNFFKSFEGTIAGIIAGTIGALFFVPIYAAFPSAFFTMLIEAIEIKILRYKIDDNLFIPLVSALILFFIL